MMILLPEPDHTVPASSCCTNALSSSSGTGVYATSHLVQKCQGSWLGKFSLYLKAPGGTKTAET